MTATGQRSAHRPTIAATRHAIAAGHYLAATAGFDILQAGGNAIDAGVAAGIALGVVQSDLVNVAGVAPILIYLADRREVVTIAGLGPWPKALDPEFFMREHAGKIPVGVLRTVVPAAPDAWITALRRYGTMSFGAVAAAAMALARDGFPMYPLMAGSLERHAERHRSWPSSAAIYLPGGRPPETGDIFRQSDLAASLQFMADEEKAAAGRGRDAGLEAARDAFYRGDIAQRIVRFMREEGGLLSADDLADYHSPVGPAERRRFGDLDVFTCGAWCQGPVLLQTLALLDGIDLEALRRNSADYVHTLTEALKLAFADREAYYTDPAVGDVPLPALMSPEYAAARRRLIRPDRAWPEMPPPGQLGIGAGMPQLSEILRPSAPNPFPEPDTSYVCVADRWGNLFSATPSDGSYGSPVVPGTGLIPSNRGSQSRPDPRHPAGVAPGKRPRLTPNPALAIRGGGAEFLPFGTPGGDVQTQAMLQVLLNIFVHGDDVQSAIEAPRFASYSYPSSFAPYDYYPGRLNIEGRFPPEVVTDLARRGHQVERWPEWSWLAGAVCAIRSTPGRGLLEAGADPRRAAYALGW
ncbi:MAG TPA: gamma-glutamyltransferase family protein [Stellaceae bacterium]|nr:gamma-glutamyltransferase family protein [Stellaceae bacterium]